MPNEYFHKQPTFQRLYNNYINNKCFFQQKITPNILSIDKVFGVNAMVRATGLEPARIFPLEPKSSAFANSATPAYVGFIEF